MSKAKVGRPGFRQQYEAAKGIKSKEFFPTLTNDLEGVETIKEAVERIQTVTEGQVAMGAIPLRNALRKGYNGRIPKGSSAWKIGHISRGRPVEQD